MCYSKLVRIVKRDEDDMTDKVVSPTDEAGHDEGAQMAPSHYFFGETYYFYDGE